MNQQIFVYGWLKPGLDTPKHTGVPHQDTIKGDCYEFNNDAHAVNVGPQSKNIIHGYVLTVSPQEMLRIDKEEHPGFDRKQTMTARGEKVWTWEYPGKIPKNAKLIDRFMRSGGDKRK